MFAPVALYFPYTDISKHRLDQALLFFKKIILYRLPEDQLEDYFSLAVQKGLVEVSEVNFFQNPAEIRQILAEMKQWFYQKPDPAYLSALHQKILDSQDGELPSQLISSIRRHKPGQVSKHDPARDAQLLLHFARYLHQQVDEVNELMDKVYRKERRLGDILGLEARSSFDANEKEIGADELKQTREDPGLSLLAPRLTAWGHFFSVYGSGKVPLFSDRHEVFDELDQALARTRPRSVLTASRLTEVLEPFLEVFLPYPNKSVSLDEIENQRNEMEMRLGSEWLDLMARVSDRVWTREGLIELKKTFSNMTQKAHLKSAAAAGESGLALRGYLLPGADLKEAYLQAAGLVRDVKETGVYCGPIFEIRPIPA